MTRSNGPLPKLFRTIFLLPIFVWAVTARMGDLHTLMIVLAFGFINLIDGLLWKFNNGMISKKIPTDSLLGACILTLATLAVWGMLCACPLPAALVTFKRVVLMFFGLSIAGALITYSKKPTQVHTANPIENTAASSAVGSAASPNVEPSTET